MKLEEEEEEKEEIRIGIEIETGKKKKKRRHRSRSRSGSEDNKLIRKKRSRSKSKSEREKDRISRRRSRSRHRTKHKRESISSRYSSSDSSYTKRRRRKRGRRTDRRRSRRGGRHRNYKFDSPPSSYFDESDQSVSKKEKVKDTSRTSGTAFNVNTLGTVDNNTTITTTNTNGLNAISGGAGATTSTSNLDVLLETLNSQLSKTVSPTNNDLYTRLLQGMMLKPDATDTANVLARATALGSPNLNLLSNLLLLTGTGNTAVAPTNTATTALNPNVLLPALNNNINTNLLTSAAAAAATSAVPSITNVNTGNLLAHLNKDTPLNLNQLCLALDVSVEKTARELYVGNIPQNVEVNEVVKFLNTCLLILYNKENTDETICVRAYIRGDSHFAFFEFRDILDTSNCMLLNGINFNGTNLKIGRPKTFPTDLLPLIPPASIPPIDEFYLSQGIPGIRAFSVFDQSGNKEQSENPVPLNMLKLEKLCVSNIAKTHETTKMKELLEAFGELKSCKFFDGEDNNSYICLVEYKNADNAVQAYKILNKNTYYTMKFEHEVVNDPYISTLIKKQIMAEQNSFMNLQVPTKVLILSKIATFEELSDPCEYREIVDDITEECEKFGKVLEVVVPVVDRDIYEQLCKQQEQKEKEKGKQKEKKKDKEKEKEERKEKEGGKEEVGGEEEETKEYGKREEVEAEGGKQTEEKSKHKHVVGEILKDDGDSQGELKNTEEEQTTTEKKKNMENEEVDESAKQDEKEKKKK